MKAQANGIDSVITLETEADFPIFKKAIPDECRFIVSWADSSATFNRLGDKIRTTHLDFRDGAPHTEEYSKLGTISSFDSFAWNIFPATASVTNIAAAKNAKIDEQELEIRTRLPQENPSDAQNNWYDSLGVQVASPTVVIKSTTVDQEMAAAKAAAVSVAQTATELAATVAAEQAQAIAAATAAAAAAAAAQASADLKAQELAKQVADDAAQKIDSQSKTAEKVSVPTTITTIDTTTSEVKTTPVVAKPAPIAPPETPLSSTPAPMLDEEAVVTVSEGAVSVKKNYLPWIGGFLLLFLLLRNRD